MAAKSGHINIKVLGIYRLRCETLLRKFDLRYTVKKRVHSKENGNDAFGVAYIFIFEEDYIMREAIKEYMSCEGRFLFLTDKQVYSSEPGESQNSGKTRGLPMEQLSDNDCIKR